MTNINTAITRNKFVEFWMKRIPDDPYTQSQYMYILTSVVFFGLLGYGLTAWYTFFTGLSIKYFFSACFMTAISIISLFGLKQTRAQYLVMKEMKNQPQKEIENVDEMLKQFQN